MFLVWTTTKDSSAQMAQNYFGPISTVPDDDDLVDLVSSQRRQQLLLKRKDLLVLEPPPPQNDEHLYYFVMIPMLMLPQLKSNMTKMTQ
jgi:hypothetical protein